MRHVRSIIFFLLLGLSSLILSCGGGGGGGESPTSPTTLNIAGTWDVTVTITEGTCRRTTITGTGPITQTGNNVTMVMGDTTLTGTLDGNQLSLEGAWSDPPFGARLILIGTVSSDGMSMNGTYEKIGSGGECSEKGTFTATKR